MPLNVACKWSMTEYFKRNWGLESDITHGQGQGYSQKHMFDNMSSDEFEDYSEESSDLSGNSFEFEDEEAESSDL